MAEPLPNPCIEPHGLVSDAGLPKRADAPATGPGARTVQRNRPPPRRLSRPIALEVPMATLPSADKSAARAARHPGTAPSPRRRLLPPPVTALSPRRRLLPLPGAALSPRRRLLTPPGAALSPRRRLLPPAV